MNTTDIIDQMAADDCARIVRAVIRALQRQESTLSGDLRNAWNDVCVQVQGELSPLWGRYADLIMDYASGELEKLPEYRRVSLWLQSDEGCEWRHGGLGARPPYCDSETARYLLSQVWRAADGWSNPTIRDYGG